MSAVTNYTWQTQGIDVDIAYGDDIPPYIASIRTHGQSAAPTAFDQPQSLVQICANGMMQGNFGSRYSETIIGNDLRYVSHDIESDDRRETLRIVAESERFGVRATVRLSVTKGASALQAVTTVRNIGGQTLHLTSLSSLSAYVELGEGDADAWDIISGLSDWTSENRWRRERLRDYELVSVLDIHRRKKANRKPGDDARSGSVTSFGNTMTRSSVSSRSTAHALPEGALINASNQRAIAWQVDFNGPWLWQLGERMDGFYLVLSGPTDVEHHWSVDLQPGEEYASVPATVAVCDAGLDGVIGELTTWRRAMVRPHKDHDTLPVVFNDYMNTFMGNPTADKELPLIEAAAKVGIEYYCIDCGWYDEHGDWWPSVGEWKESATRFPHGLSEVIDAIRAHGMQPGIWLEPEVMGVSCALAKTFPEEAFLHADGYRIETHLRYLLDMRNETVRRHLDSTVDHLVNDLGIRYFKLDYNINTGAGTDTHAPSRGEGQRECSDAYLSWLNGVLDRHPDVTFETCSSGAMRADWATLEQAQLQSTSDQQDYRLYANISASSPMSMLPEQCGNWAYPNKDMTLNQVEYTMVNGLVGRPYVSGYLTQMSDEQIATIAEALSIYKEFRKDIASSVPFWPLGLPKWRDDIVALGLKAGNARYLALWAKRPVGGSVVIPMGEGIEDAVVSRLYGADVPVRWEPTSAAVMVDASGVDSDFAVLMRIESK